MKIKLNRLKCIGIISMFLLLASAVTSFAQTGQMSLQNCEAVAANRIEFDVFFKNTTINSLQYNSTVIRINYNAAMMPATGQFTSLAWGYVGGATFPNSWPPINTPTFTVSNGTNPRFLTTSTGTGIYLNGTTCAAPNIAAGDSIKLGRFFFQVNGGTFVAGQSTGLVFNTGSNLIGYISCASVTSSFLPAKITYCNLTIPSACTVSATSSSTNVSCNGGSNGTASVTASGSSPFTYLWSNGATTSSITGLAAGTYSVTVTGTGGCTTTSSVTITEPSPLTASASAGTIACQGGSTTVSVTAAGGTGTVTGTGEFVVQAGSYTYTVTDANGCTATAAVSVADGAATSTNSDSQTACDSYTWTVNGQTYTQSGTYSSVSGCVTNVLTLTITPSSTAPTTASACDSYTWAVNGQTYTQSGTYSSVSGCVTNVLTLTITPSSTVQIGRAHV